MIASILTPILLAMAPTGAPAEKPVYDWNTQRTEVVSGGGKAARAMQLGHSWRGTQSYIGGGLVIDDMMPD